MDVKPTFTGGCYCGDVRYQCEGPPLLRGLCYCRTCQAISGGAGNLYMAVEAKSFQFTKGAPRSFNKKDRPGSPTRHFCEACGVHLTARSDRALDGADLALCLCHRRARLFDALQVVSASARDAGNRACKIGATGLSAPRRKSCARR